MHLTGFRQLFRASDLKSIRTLLQDVYKRQSFALKAINYFYEANTALLLSVVDGTLKLYKCAFENEKNVKMCIRDSHYCACKK